MSLPMLRYALSFLLLSLLATAALAGTGYEVTSKDGDKTVTYMAKRAARDHFSVSCLNWDLKIPAGTFDDLQKNARRAPLWLGGRPDYDSLKDNPLLAGGILPVWQIKSQDISLEIFYYGDCEDKEKSVKEWRTAVEESHTRSIPADKKATFLRKRTDSVTIGDEKFNVSVLDILPGKIKTGRNSSRGWQSRRVWMADIKQNHTLLKAYFADDEQEKVIRTVLEGSRLVPTEKEQKVSIAAPSYALTLPKWYNAQLLVNFGQVRIYKEHLTNLPLMSTYDPIFEVRVLKRDGLEAVLRNNEGKLMHERVKFVHHLMPHKKFDYKEGKLAFEVDSEVKSQVKAGRIFQVYTEYFKEQFGVGHNRPASLIAHNRPDWKYEQFVQCWFHEGEEYVTVVGVRSKHDKRAYFCTDLIKGLELSASHKDPQ